MSAMPEDPVTNMEEMGIQLHALFVALLRGGFTTRQACHVIAVYISQVSRP